MKLDLPPRVRRSILAASALVALGLGACRTGGDDVERNASGAKPSGTTQPVPAAYALAAPARVRGTALDATTGRRVASARIAAPNGRPDGTPVETTSDEQGRFELQLPAGWSGALTAEGPDGTRAELRLLPLRPGVLEVVVRLVGG